MALELLHHLDATAVTILASVSVGLPALWLAWVPVRNTSRSATSNADPAAIVGSGRYAKAIMQLGSKKLEVRIGGIYATHWSTSQPIQPKITQL